MSKEGGQVEEAAQVWGWQSKEPGQCQSTAGAGKDPPGDTWPPGQGQGAWVCPQQQGAAAKPGRAETALSWGTTGLMPRRTVPSPPVRDDSKCCLGVRAHEQGHSRPLKRNRKTAQVPHTGLPGGLSRAERRVQGKVRASVSWQLRQALPGLMPQFGRTLPESLKSREMQGELEDTRINGLFFFFNETLNGSSEI